MIITLTMIFACVSFMSCGNKENNAGGAKNDGDAKGDITNPDNAATKEDTSAERLYPDIPEADYGGHTFTILVSLNNVLDDIWNDFHAEEETGDSINDAIYSRNVFVEEKYKIKIADIVDDPTDKAMDRPKAQKMIKNTIQAGDNAYDAAMLSGYAACALTTGGFLLDMNSMAPLDLTKPWWDQKANRDLTIKDKMFYTTGDISNVVNEATYTILFNKKLVQEYGLESPYELVKRGEWTYDKLIEMGMQVSTDINGDGKFDFEDRYGAFIWDDTMMGVVNAIGEKCAKINGKGEIELTLLNERMLTTFDKYIRFALDKAHALMYQREDWSGDKTNVMFENDQGLFYLQIMELVVRLRAMELDFGVLPYPKFDAAQKDYYSTVSSWHSGFICVPKGQADISRTGAILEAMAAESMYTLKPAYYELALKGKLVRDADSEDMLDLIFDSKIYDAGWLYQIGGFNEEIMNLYRNRKTDFVSMYEKREAKALKDIDKINAALETIIN